jgi:hypothetical protein
MPIAKKRLGEAEIDKSGTPELRPQMVSIWKVHAFVVSYCDDGACHVKWTSSLLGKYLLS